MLHTLLIQGDTRWEDPTANRAYYGEKIAKAEWPAQGARLIILPETFNTGFSMAGSAVAEAPGGDSVAWMRGLAKEHQAHVLGSLYVQEDQGGGRVHNRAYLISPEGVPHHYDKAHLFPLSQEHEVYSPGAERSPVFRLGDWGLSLAICYDLRFPLWLRNDATRPYDLLVVVANWPEARSTHWRTLLEARAIENQSYVVGVNRVGKDGNGYSYSGDSLVVDPWGHRVADLGSTDCATLVSLDRRKVGEARSAIPSLADADAFELLSR